MKNQYEDSDLTPEAGEALAVELEGGEIIPNGLPPTFNGGFDDPVIPLEEAVVEYRQKQTEATNDPVYQEQKAA